jgi:hypothetical protein
MFAAQVSNTAYPWVYPGDFRERFLDWLAGEPLL